jgi:DNA-binding NtrC family response regulator
VTLMSQGEMRSGLKRQDEVALLGESAAMAALRVEIETATRSQAKIMVSGETGVGKEVVARLIHQMGARCSRRFVAINCSGIPETLLESELFGHTRGSFTGAYRDKPGLVRLADGGTLFLDELGEMSLRMQAVLLRFVETGEVQPVGADGPVGHADVRLITATHRDLRAEIDAGSFREDLYYRLNVIQIQVPPLRDRGEDVRQLLHHFLRESSHAHGLSLPTITPEAEQLLLNHRWPGNVRELKNVAERLVVGCPAGRVTPDDLPHDLRSDRNGARPIVVKTACAEPTSNAPNVAGPFKSHDLTRRDLRGVIFRGLEHTRGNYRQLVRTFHMPDTDYKRFLSFLSQHDCNLPFQAHRAGEAQAPIAPSVYEVAC